MLTKEFPFCPNLVAMSTSKTFIHFSTWNIFAGFLASESASGVPQAASVTQPDRQCADTRHL